MRWLALVVASLALLSASVAHAEYPDKPVRVGASTEGSTFEFWVANEGDPIPDAAMGKLFEPFFRGDIRDSRQGLGLGLHIASRIAEAHVGRIAVTSTAEETPFAFTVPLQVR